MHTPTNAAKAGEAIAENSETRTTAPTVSGLNQNSEQLNHTDLPSKRKTVKDSRAEVIAKSRALRIGLKTYTTSPEKIASLEAIRDAMPGNSSSTQEMRIHTALGQWSLSTFEASRYLDAYDPRARVMGLRNKGHNILTSWALVPTECGKMHRLGVYTLQRGGDGGAA